MTCLLLLKESWVGVMKRPGWPLRSVPHPNPPMEAGHLPLVSGVGSVSEPQDCFISCCRSSPGIEGFQEGPSFSRAPPEWIAGHRPGGAEQGPHHIPDSSPPRLAFLWSAVSSSGGCQHTGENRPGRCLSTQSKFPLLGPGLRLLCWDVSVCVEKR